MTLFRKILLPALGISVLSLVIAAPLILRTSAAMERAATLAQGSAASIEVTRGLDIILSLAQHQAQMLAESPLAAHLLRAGPHDPAFASVEAANGPLLRFREQLLYSTHAIQAVHIVDLIDPSGRIVCSSNRLVEGTRRGDRLYFQDAMQGAPAAEGPLTSRASGKPVFALAVPVKAKGGKVLGVLVIAIDLDYLNKALVEPVEIRRRGNVYTLSATGQVIMHPSRSDMLNTGWFTSAQLAEMQAHGSGVMTRITSTDETLVSAYVTLPYPGWIVIFEEESDLWPRIPLLRNISLLAWLSPLLALLGIVMPLLHFLRRDIRKTTAATKAWTAGTAEGDGAAAKAIRRRDEFGELSRAVRDLANARLAAQCESADKDARIKNLRETLEALSLSVDDMGGGVAVIRLDSQCTILQASKGFYHLHGLVPGAPLSGALPEEPEVQLGAGAATGPLRGIHPDDVSGLEDIITSATRKKIPVIACYRIRQKDGKITKLCLRGHPAGEDGGFPVFVTVFFNHSFFEPQGDSRHADKTPPSGASA